MAGKNYRKGTSLAKLFEMFPDDEARELHDLLADLVGGDTALGELLKSIALPIDDPAPPIVLPSRSFVFTGTFIFGSSPAGVTMRMTPV